MRDINIPVDTDWPAGEPRVRRSPHLKADEAYLIKPEFTADGRTYLLVPEAVGDEEVAKIEQMLEEHDTSMARMDHLIELLSR